MSSPSERPPVAMSTGTLPTGLWGLNSFFRASASVIFPVRTKLDSTFSRRPSSSAMRPALYALVSWFAYLLQTASAGYFSSGSSVFFTVRTWSSISRSSSGVRAASARRYASALAAAAAATSSWVFMPWSTSTRPWCSIARARPRRRALIAAEVKTELKPSGQNFNRLSYAF